MEIKETVGESPDGPTVTHFVHLLDTEEDLERWGINNYSKLEAISFFPNYFLEQWGPTIREILNSCQMYFPHHGENREHTLQLKIFFEVIGKWETSRYVTTNSKVPLSHLSRSVSLLPFCLLMSHSLDHPHYKK